MKYQIKDLFDWTITTGHYGFFELLSMARFGSNYLYTTEEGNPYNTWLQEIGDPGDETYKGLSAKELDYAYLSRSSEKVVTNFVTRSFGIESEYDVDKAGRIVVNIVRKYAAKWLSLWETMFYDYDPIENYNMTEQLTDQITEYEHGHVETYENGKVNTRSGSVKETPGVTITETKSMKGFDSDAFVGTDQNVSAPSGFNQTEYTNLKDTASGTDTHRNSGTDKETKNYMLTRSGNIGVTTSQQMIEQERKILMFNYFDQIVFPDIDKELTIKVY